MVTSYRPVEAIVSQFLSLGVYVLEVPSGQGPIAGVGTSTAAILGVLPNTWELPEAQQSLGQGDGTTKTFSLARAVATGSVKVKVNDADVAVTVAAPDAATAVLCTTWTDFTTSFGGFHAFASARYTWLAHAVYGFFANGGTRCYVSRVAPPAEEAKLSLGPALTALEGIDEVAIVLAPGLTAGTAPEATSAQTDIIEHCALTTDRFAIFDAPETLSTGNLAGLGKDGADIPSSSDYAALYFPWLQVDDPAKGRSVHVPPSGHMAGIYARVDASRGVHRAPANEPVRGMTGLRYTVSRAQQDGLNPHGVNVIRDLNGSIRVWGARTLGGDANGEWKYINVRGEPRDTSRRALRRPAAGPTWCDRTGMLVVFQRLPLLA